MDNRLARNDNNCSILARYWPDSFVFFLSGNCCQASSE